MLRRFINNRYFFGNSADEVMRKLKINYDDYYFLDDIIKRSLYRLCKEEKMSSTGEIRVHKNRGYTVIPNDILRDINLTLKAKALLGLMLSLPDDWDYTVAGLTKLVKEGDDSVDSRNKELIKFGYVYREESRKEKGYFKYI